MEKIYENIKTRRIELEMTQEELAKKLGYADKSMIAKIEAGKVDLARSKILAFASALKTSPSWLMGWDEDDTAAPPAETSALTPPEQSLIADFRQLNDEGQEKAASYTRDLVDTGKYIKSNKPVLLDQEA